MNTALNIIMLRNWVTILTETRASMITYRNDNEHRRTPETVQFLDDCIKKYAEEIDQLGKTIAKLEVLEISGQFADYDKNLQDAKLLRRNIDGILASRRND